VIAVAASVSLGACKDAVTGQAATGSGLVAVQVEATSGVSGEKPTGTVFFHLGGGNGNNWRGEVSCLSVRGDTAIIGFGEDYWYQLPSAAWVTGLVRIVDNGPGPGDTFEYVELERGESGPLPPPGDPLPGPTECSTFPPGQTVFVLSDLEGNLPGLRVNDALPLRAANG
jgi:hypothetical protein